MNNKKHKKYVIVIVSVIAIILGIKIGYCCTYVGDIVVTYPWDEYTIFEKAASTIMGYSNKHITKQELYDKGLISKNQNVFQKFNDSYYNKNKEQAIECNFKKEELEKMYISQSKYIGENINFVGSISTDIGMNPEIKAILVENCKTEEEKESILKDIENLKDDIIMLKIEDTNVTVQIEYPKEKIDYTNWIKGKKLKVSGKIEKIENGTNMERIYLDNTCTIDEYK